MSAFAVEARRIKLSPMENADRLELANIVGTEYVAVVPKGQYQDDDLIVYIPEQAILPEAIIEELGLGGEKTMLAGGDLNPDGSKVRNRVKALRLRGTLSQGLVYGAPGLGGLEEGCDYAEELGITKYAPPIPIEMSGEAEPQDGLRSYTDIENIKKYPNVLQEGEEVCASEKCHGTCSIMSLIDGELAISSKGMASRGLKLLDERDGQGKLHNVYHRMAERYGVEEKLRILATRYEGEIITLFGETLGVQELRYGLSGGELDFRAFDLRVGSRYLDFDEFLSLCAELDIPTVPIVYRGPYDREKIEELATGREQVTGKEAHHREGVVVKPVVERYDAELGRVILKVISWRYLAKKGDDGTEFE